jgi:hypothetical protein
MAYTNSEAYIHYQAYVPDTISDAPGAGTDAPGTPDAGETTDDGASPPSCAHAPSGARPPSYVSPRPRRGWSTRTETSSTRRVGDFTGLL